MTANFGTSINIGYSGNLGSVLGAFSGTCNFTLTDIGGGSYGLNGPCGSGGAYAGGSVAINVSGPNFTGSFTGTWNGSGASGVINATVNPGINIYAISRSGSTIGFILMDPSTGVFNGLDQGSSVSGYINSQGIGAITLGGNYYAAMTGTGIFGTYTNFNAGIQYAIGGTTGNFFMVNSGGGIVGTGSVSSIATNDPGWQTYFVQNNLPVPSGFNSLLSTTFNGGLFYAGTPYPSGDQFFGPAGSRIAVTSP